MSTQLHLQRITARLETPLFVSTCDGALRAQQLWRAGH